MEHIFFFRTNEDKTATFSSFKKKIDSRLSASLYCILTDSHSLSRRPPPPRPFGQKKPRQSRLRRLVFFSLSLLVSHNFLFLLFLQFMC